MQLLKIYPSRGGVASTWSCLSETRNPVHVKRVAYFRPLARRFCDFAPGLATTIDESPCRLLNYWIRNSRAFGPRERVVVHARSLGSSPTGINDCETPVHRW
jgi:hypothetical protein